MSAFLGPIHYWVFNKVKLQNEITDRLIDFAKEKNIDLAAVLAEKYGQLEDAPLEEIINTSNIHGWLQERVSLVEYRLATAVKILLDRKAADLDELKSLFQNIGLSIRQESVASAAAAYKLLNDLLLDGMPCDRANELISESDSEVQWRRNVCVHSIYWDEVGIDIEIYYALRESLIAGLLENSGYEFTVRGEEYAVKKR